MSGVFTISEGVDSRVLPRHVAVILDGNRRWATERGLPTAEGHRAGVRRLLEVVEWANRAGIGTLTSWVLSIDNLGRSRAELSELLPLIGETVERLAAQQRWRIHHIGCTEALPAHLQVSLARAQDATRDVDGMLLNVAVGYDGRREMADALASAVSEVQAGDGAPDWESLIARHLYTRGQADVDLIIRTSGVQRLSGFLSWQSAYAALISRARRSPGAIAPFIQRP